MFPKHTKNYFAYISQDFSSFENLVEYLLTKSETDYEISLKDLKFNLKDRRNINMPKNSKSNVIKKDVRLDAKYDNKMHINKQCNTVSSHNITDNVYCSVDDSGSCNIQSTAKEIEYKQTIEGKNDINFVKYNMAINDYNTEVQNTYGTSESIQRSTTNSSLNPQSQTSSSTYAFKTNSTNTKTYNYPNLFPRNLITQTDPTHYRKLAQEHYKPMISRDIKLANEYFAMRASENIEKAIYYDYKASEIILGQMMKHNNQCAYHNANNGCADKKYYKFCEKLLITNKVLEKIDFHKLRVEECIDFLKDYIKYSNPAKLEIITGKSERIKPTVIKYLEENGYKVEIDRIVSVVFIKK